MVVSRMIMKVTNANASKTASVNAGMPTGFGIAGKYSSPPARNGTMSANSPLTRPATQAKGRQWGDGSPPSGNSRNTNGRIGKMNAQTQVATQAMASPAGSIPGRYNRV
jgi:hypothetical protein